MRDQGSFRDHSGFVFSENNKIYRVVNQVYKEHYDKLMSSGLYEKLVELKQLIPHKELESQDSISKNQYKLLEAEKIDFISYPFEWSFSQYKEAALLTLEIQKTCIVFGMILKDATPYNIQFDNNNPIFIDTLSFEILKDNNYGWVAYKQFCEMFLNPLCLMKFVDPEMSKLMVSSINGISAEDTLKFLPFKSKFNPTIIAHIVLPSKIKSKKKESNQDNKANKRTISKTNHLNIVNQLINFIQNLKPKNLITEWGDYINETVDEKSDYVVHKEETVAKYAEKIDFNIAWDIGANDGHFSRILAKNEDSHIYSMDIEWKSVNINYLRAVNNKENNIFPLKLDLSNPSPGIGWLNTERPNIFERLPKTDVILCLALMHHIINLNVPLSEIVNLFSFTKKYLIVEYVPLSDPKCQEIFSSRIDTINYPTEVEFKSVLGEKYTLIEETYLKETKRKLFLYEKI